MAKDKQKDGPKVKNWLLAKGREVKAKHKFQTEAEILTSICDIHGFTPEQYQELTERFRS